MWKRARPGTCGFCEARVWADTPDGWPVVLEGAPLEPSAVVPALRARVPLYQRLPDAWGPLWAPVGRLELARALAQGQGAPEGLYLEHPHATGFRPDESAPLEGLPIEPPF